MPDNQSNFRRNVDSDSERIRDFLAQGATRWVIFGILAVVVVGAVVLTFVHP